MPVWGSVPVWGSEENENNKMHVSYCLFNLQNCHLFLNDVFPIILISKHGKEFTYNAGDPGSISGSGRSPGEENGNPLQYSCLGKFHGQRSLIGYSLQSMGRKRVGHV